VIMLMLPSHILILNEGLLRIGKGTKITVLDHLNVSLLSDTPLVKLL